MIKGGSRTLGHSGVLPVGAEAKLSPTVPRVLRRRPDLSGSAGLGLQGLAHENRGPAGVVVDHHGPTICFMREMPRPRAGNGGGVFDAVARAPPHSWPAGRRPSHRGSTPCSGASQSRTAVRIPDRDRGSGRAPTHLPETRGTDVCQLISLRQARRRSYRRARFSTAANPSTCGGVTTRIRPPSPCSVGSLPLQRRGRILDRPRPAPGARALTQLRPFGCGTPSRNARPGGSDHGCSVGRSRRR